MSEMRAPVQGFSAGIPWSMHLRAYDAYCKKYGPQAALIDLEGRNCRGGFGTSELDEFIPGWRKELDDYAALLASHKKLVGALDKLARLGNEPHFGNSTGNEIARAALREAEKVSE